MQIAHLEVRTEGDVVVAAIRGEIDMSNARELALAIRAPLTNRSLGLVLDLAGVSYLDSAAIHMIYELRERLTNRGQRLQLVAPCDAAALALELMAVPAAIPVAATASEARAAILAGHPR